MNSEPQQPQRDAYRLPGYDYTSAGYYFVTICIQNRRCLLGEIAANRMRLNAAGRMVQDAWDALERTVTGVRTDAFVVMPNHIHGIVILTPPEIGLPAAEVAAQRLSLSDVMQRFKSWTTTQYSEGVRQNGWTPFPKRLWHRSFYERIVRNERALAAIREYIVNNPANWQKDRDHPDAPVGEYDRYRI